MDPGISRKANASIMDISPLAYKLFVYYLIDRIFFLVIIS
jgi:hypothetical protein